MCNCNCSKSIDQSIRMKILTTCIWNLYTQAFSGCQKQKNLLYYLQWKLTYLSHLIFTGCSAFQFIWPCNKMKRDFWSHSPTNSIYCEFFVWQNVKYCCCYCYCNCSIHVVFGCWLFFSSFKCSCVYKLFNGNETKPNRKCKNTEEVPILFLFFRRKV